MGWGGGCVEIRFGTARDKEVVRYNFMEAGIFQRDSVAGRDKVEGVGYRLRVVVDKEGNHDAEESNAKDASFVGGSVDNEARGVDSVHAT